ncbi:protein kinase [Aspergillus lentulus]|nr:protein kinase [Aspergillus lentulus]
MKVIRKSFSTISNPIRGIHGTLAVLISGALDIFTIPRPGGDHPCLVQKLRWESYRDLLYHNPNHQFSEDLLKAGLMQIFIALDYLHTECKLVHTGKMYQYGHQKRQYSPRNTAQFNPGEFCPSCVEEPFTSQNYQWYACICFKMFDLLKVFGRAVLSDFSSAVWDLFEGKHLFYGNDPDDKGYSTRAHLTEEVRIFRASFFRFAAAWETGP